MVNRLKIKIIKLTRKKERVGERYLFQLFSVETGPCRNAMSVRMRVETFPGRQRERDGERKRERKKFELKKLTLGAGGLAEGRASCP